MGVELDEKPIRACGNLNAGLEPGVKTIDRRRLVSLDATVLDSRDHPPLAPFPVENQGSLNEQERIGDRGCSSGMSSEVMRLGPYRIINRIIDAVDCPSLGRVWSRGQGEIGVTTGFAQDPELVVDPATTPVGPRVIEGPVTVDETVEKISRVFVSRKETMASRRSSLNARRRARSSSALSPS